MGDTQVSGELSALSRWPVILLFTLLAAWFLFLAGLVLLSSNPVTMNLRQLAASISIVRVRVEDPALGKCSTLETLSGRPVIGELLISNLHETSARAGQEYIIPLSLNQERWEVTHLPPVQLFPAEVPALIYPADQATEDQLARTFDTSNR